MLTVTVFDADSRAAAEEVRVRRRVGRRLSSGVADLREHTRGRMAGNAVYDDGAGVGGALIVAVELDREGDVGLVGRVGVGLTVDGDVDNGVSGCDWRRERHVVVEDILCCGDGREVRARTGCAATERIDVDARLKAVNNTGGLSSNNGDTDGSEQQHESAGEHVEVTR